MLKYPIVSNDYKNIDDIKEVIKDPHFKEYLSLGFIDEIALRNAIIRYEYRKLKQYNSAYESITILSDKFNLSDSTISTILFRKREKKKVFWEFENI